MLDRIKMNSPERETPSQYKAVESYALSIMLQKHRLTGTESDLELLKRLYDLEHIPSLGDQQNIEEINVQQIMMQSLSSEQSATEMCKIFSDNPWVIRYLSSKEDDSLYRRGEDNQPSSLMIFNVFLTGLIVRYPEAARNLIRSLIRNLDLLFGMNGAIWVQNLLSVLRISSSHSERPATEAGWYSRIPEYDDVDEMVYYDNFCRQRGAAFLAEFLDLAPEEVGYLQRYHQTLIAQIVTDNRLKVIIKDRKNDYKQLRENATWPGAMEVVNQGREDGVLATRSLSKQIPDLTSKSGHEGKSDWIRYERALIESIRKIGSRELGPISAEVKKIAMLLADANVQLTYPQLLNILRDKLSAAIRKKRYHEEKDGLKYIAQPTTDYDQYNEEVLVYYLAYRTFLFPNEDIFADGAQLLPAHLHLLSVYEESKDFNEYDESLQLQQGYRKEMFRQILQTLRTEHKIESVYEIGSGDSWLGAQIAELGVKVHGLEADPTLLAQARGRIDSLGVDSEKITVTDLNWDNIDQWAENNVEERATKNEIAMFTWLGRSASHEETEVAFVSTLKKFAHNMNVGDYLVMDMPDPTTGEYDWRINQLINGLNKLIEDSGGTDLLDRKNFPYIVDSPNNRDCYNRFIPNYEQLVKIFAELRFDIVPVDMGKIGTEPGDFRYNLNRKNDRKCINERVNAQPLSDKRGADTDLQQRMNERRNMVFILTLVDKPSSSGIEDELSVKSLQNQFIDNRDPFDSQLD